MTTCMWCSVDFDAVKIKTRVWDGRLECADVRKCERRRMQRQAAAANEATERRQTRAMVQEAFERRVD